MSPKDLAKLLVSLCSFFLFRVNEYFKTNIPHVYLSTQTRTLFIQSVNVASCPAQFQAWASFNTSTKCNLPLEDTRFGECPLGFFGSYQPTLSVVGHLWAVKLITFRRRLSCIWHPTSVPSMMTLVDEYLFPLNRQAYVPQLFPWRPQWKGGNFQKHKIYPRNDDAAQRSPRYNWLNAVPWTLASTNIEFFKIITLILAAMFRGILTSSLIFHKIIWLWMPVDNIISLASRV